MKIAYDYQVFSQQVYGGISRYICELAKELYFYKNNKKSFIVSPFYINNYLDEYSQFINFKGTKLPYIPKTTKLIKLLNIFFAKNQIKHIRPDILHETYYSAKPIINGNHKYVLTVHDMIHELFPQYFSKFDRTTILKKKAVERADHIICISKNTREDLIRIFNVQREKTSVIYHGFNLNITNNDTCPLKKDFILFVGARYGYKNFKNFLLAFSKSTKLKDKFKIIAFGGGAFTRNERKFIKEIGLSMEIVRQESGNDDKLKNYYKYASLMVYPSFYEGFGMPPLEAMSFNCPVACSNKSSIPEIVSDAALMFDPYSVNSIKQSIEIILENETLRNKLIEKGKKRINNFSWESCAKKTYELYEQLLCKN